MKDHLAALALHCLHPDIDCPLVSPNASAAKDCRATQLTARGLNEDRRLTKASVEPHSSFKYGIAAIAPSFSTDLEAASVANSNAAL